MPTGKFYAQKWLVKYMLSIREYASVKAACMHIDEIDPLLRLRLGESEKERDSRDWLQSESLFSN